MIKWCVNHKSIVFMLSVTLILVGIFSYLGLERQENPSVTAPMAVIQCIYPGATPVDVEKQVIKPIEKEIAGMEEIKTVESFAMDSVGIVKVTLNDMSDAKILQTWDDVKSNLDIAKEELPDSAEEPTIDTNLSQSYGVVIGISSLDYTNEDINQMAEKLKNRLQKIEGVAAIDIEGKVEQEINVYLDMAKLKQYGLSPSTIGIALKARNVNIPGGNLELADGKLSVQVTGEYQDLDEIKNTIVGVSTESGQPVYLKNVAEIRQEEGSSDAFARINNEKGVIIGIRYAEGLNVMKVGKEIDKELDQFKEETLYANMNMTVLTDQADYVRDSLKLFTSNLASAIILVIAVVWIAMGARSALVVSTPIALVIAAVLGYMKLTGIPLHQMSIASLVISLSLLVANGIVANDNMYLYLQQGKSRQEACVTGVKDVSIPILSSTLTTIASFLPLALMKGSAGKFAVSLPILVSVALIASYFIAITVVPALGYKVLEIKSEESAKNGKLKILLNKYLRKIHIIDISSLKDSYVNNLKNLQSLYERILDKAIHKPKKSIIIAFSALIISGLFIPTLGIQVFPPLERDQYVLSMTMPDSSTLEKTGEATDLAGKILDEELSVDNYAYEVGTGFMKYYVTFNQAQQGSNVAEFLVNGTKSEAERISERISMKIPNATVNVKYLEINLPQDYPIQIRISGTDADVLQRSAEEIQNTVLGVAGVKDTQINYGHSSYKLKVKVNEQKANLVGITNYDVASTIRMAVTGSEVTQLKQKDIEKEDIPVILKMDKEQLKNGYSLDGVFINSQITGENVPLSQIAAIEKEYSLNKIVRRNEERTITVGIFLEEGASSPKVLSACQKTLKHYQLPSGYELTYGGDNEFSSETFSSMVVPALFACVLIYIILAIQFGSLLEPLIIMGTIPLSFIGILPGLRILGSPIGFMALLGAISLMGVVVNNGIVLLDYIKYLQSDNQQNKNILELVTEACKIRIRPIMIGMITTVISLMPLMISGGSLWQPLAGAVVFGMLVSSILTLIIIPCAYIVVENIRHASSLVANFTE